MTAPSTDRTRQQRPAAQGLRVAPATRQRQLPWMVLGIVLIVGGALLFMVLAGRVNHRKAVLALARPVPAGQVIKATDLKVVHLSVDGGLQLIGPGAQRQVVGKPAAVDLSANTLLIASDVGTRKGLRTGKAVVGLSLKAGQLPNTQLVAGDRVALVDTGADNGPSILAVVSIAEIKNGSSPSGTAYVSLLVDERDAPTIATAAAAGRIVLVLVSQ